MNYKEAKEYLNIVKKKGTVLGLDSIKELLNRLGNPEKNLKVVHFAGTNGKGSTMAYVESVLLDAGYQVGKYTSPAVFNEREIITVDDDYISEEDFAKYISEIKPLCDSMVEDGYAEPTVFEIETAMAYAYFSDLDLDICLIECGMGGKDDATNVFDKVLCSVITSISLDHTKELGSTIEEIKKNKEGIIKEGCPVIYAKDGEDIATINKNCAREVIDVLEHEGFKLSRYIVDGFDNAMWPGRMETVMTDPLFIIDGAHNPDAVSKLKDYIDLHFTNRRITFIMGVLADKDYSEEASIISKNAVKIITVTPENDRALDANSLSKTIGKYNENVAAAGSIKKAVDEALDSVSKNEADMIIAFGSLSYLKDVKEALGLL